MNNVILTLCVSILLYHPVFTFEDWTWINGSRNGPTYGIYGSKGVASILNFPGSREPSCSWKDSTGIFWMYGGLGNGRNETGTLNDLWRYDGVYWTWMDGTDTISVNAQHSTTPPHPGSREGSASIATPDGYLYLFGGRGYDNGGLGYWNDLWRYSIFTNTWSWISGSDSLNINGKYGTMDVGSPLNFPGSRIKACSWPVGNSGVYIFGGYGYATQGSTLGFMNDLWKWEAGVWTWVHGSNMTGQGTIVQTPQVPSPLNVPASRYGSVCWNDLSGNLWLFGGYGGSSAQTGFLNDLWMFNGEMWTFVNGSLFTNNNGVYDGNPISLLPAARSNPASWVDEFGDLYIFGGQRNEGSLSDLWKWNMEDRTWQLIFGGNKTNSYSIYGGIPKPGSRFGSGSFMDHDGNLRLFGGNGYPEFGSPVGSLNDFWMFNRVNISYVTTGLLRYTTGTTTTANPIITTSPITTGIDLTTSDPTSEISQLPLTQTLAFVVLGVVSFFVVITITTTVLAIYLFFKVKKV